MRNTLICALLLLLAVQAASAETLGTRRGKLWKIGAAVLAAATTVDAFSSWGHAEANPLLRGGNGRFGMQAVALKGAILGGTLGAQYFLLRKSPKAEKYGTITNFALSGVFATAAVTNFQRTARNARLSAPTPR